ncbi:GNAT family N-acetyltransferase [Streptomyces torulosus]|uniref:GNAT family N-acetyltransferase n=1 Tax=Streptomyces torulosus TaxID=68276 RepID=UPI0006EB67FB|nr:GNAT family N-acetyltransferase [Streptomyces torulosus]
MASALDAVVTPDGLRLGARWAVRSVADPPSERPRRPCRTYVVRSAEGGPELLVDLHPVPDHPVRACYPFGAHDLVVGLVLPGPDPAENGPGLAARLLRDLVPVLFALSPRCRRVVAAPDEDDTATQLALEAGGFRRIGEADLPGGTVVLFAVEPPAVAGLSTALDDMPH